MNAFCGYLEGDGWEVSREVDFCDIVARRAPGEVLYAEAKGRTKAIGLDVDTLYGQLLRRVPIGDDPSARFAVVVPSAALTGALRVPLRLRELLRVDVYEIPDGDVVSRIEE